LFQQSEQWSINDRQQQSVTFGGGVAFLAYFSNQKTDRKIWTATRRYTLLLLPLYWSFSMTIKCLAKGTIFQMWIICSSYKRMKHKKQTTQITKKEPTHPSTITGHLFSPIALAPQSLGGAAFILRRTAKLALEFAVIAVPHWGSAILWRALDLA